MQSISEKDFECLASTGVKTPGPMFLSLQSRLLGKAGAAVRFEIRAMQEPKSRRRWKRIAADSLGQTDTRHQVGKLRIGSERVEPRTYSHGGHSIRTVVVGLLKPCESSILVSEHGVDAGDFEDA